MHNTSYVVRINPSLVLGTWVCSQAKSYRKCTYAPSLGNLSNAGQHLNNTHDWYAQHTHTVKGPLKYRHTLMYSVTL